MGLNMHLNIFSDKKIKLTKFDLDIIKNVKEFEKFDKNFSGLLESLVYVKYLMEQIRSENKDISKKELFRLIQSLKETKNLIEYNYNLILRYLKNRYSGYFSYAIKKSNILSHLIGWIRTIEEIINDYQKNYLLFS